MAITEIFCYQCWQYVSVKDYADLVMVVSTLDMTGYDLLKSIGYRLLTKPRQQMAHYGRNPI